MILLKQERMNRELKEKIMLIIAEYKAKGMGNRLTISRITAEISKKENKKFHHAGILYHLRQLKQSGIITYKVKKKIKGVRYSDIEIISKNWEKAIWA